MKNLDEFLERFKDKVEYVTSVPGSGFDEIVLRNKETMEEKVFTVDRLGFLTEEACLKEIIGEEKFKEYLRG